jgi:lipid A 3-O-deacylase
LIPRFHIGGDVNLSRRTSSIYAGALWTVPLWDRFFAEGFLDGAVHNGSRFGTEELAALGCNPLFHVGGSLGYNLTNQWRVMTTFSHMSNGNSTLGTSCERNQGINNYGVRIGYSF